MNPTDKKIQELQREIDLLKSHKHMGTDFPKVSFLDLDMIPRGVLTTTAVTGLLPIPTCAGAPTGTPTSSYAFLVYDTSNNKLYCWTSAAWKSVTLS